MKKKRVVICILSILILAFSITNVFAALGDDGPSILDNDNNNSENDVTNIRNLIENQTQNANSSRNQNTSSNTNGIKNQMPDTGIEDMPVIAIGVCIIVAVVAYTQIRRYNNV